MILGGGSSSSSDASTETRDERVAASDQGVAIGAGAHVTIDGTTKEAWKFGEEAAKAVGSSGVALIDGVMEFGAGAIDLLTDTQERFVDFVERRT